MNLIVLAGGKSSRMQEDKALVELHGIKLIRLVLNSLSRIADNVLIITNSPEKYEWLSYKKYQDIFVDKGPLGGIHSGLVHSDTEENFVVSCDMPLISSQMAWYLTEYHSTKLARVAMAKGKLQPLFGVYSKKGIEKIEKILNSAPDEQTEKSKALSPISYLNSVDADFVEVSQLPYYNEYNFLNINSKNDLEQAKVLFNV